MLLQEIVDKYAKSDEAEVARDLLKTLKPSTVYRIMTDFRALLGYAFKLDVLDRLPKWPTQRIPEHKARFLTFEETDRLIAGLNGIIEEKTQNSPDLSEFFNQAKKALTTHQKLLEFEPEVVKPQVESPKP